MSYINRIKRKILSNWANFVFPHTRRFRGLKQGYKRMILGGVGAAEYYRSELGFQEGDVDLTVAPSSIAYIFRILKNYHSYLCLNGEVVIILHPYSLCVEHYDSSRVISNDTRYYPILHNAMIDGFNEKLHTMWGGKTISVSLPSILKGCKLGMHRYKVIDEENEISMLLCNGLYDHSIPSQELVSTINANIALLKEIQNFSLERGYSSKIFVIEGLLKGNVLKRYDTLLNDLFYIPVEKAGLHITSL